MNIISFSSTNEDVSGSWSSKRKKKEGLLYIFSVQNRDMLEHIALRERNAFDFMCLYIEKVLERQWNMDPFASFLDEQTDEQYDNLKARFQNFV